MACGTFLFTSSTMSAARLSERMNKFLPEVKSEERVLGSEISRAEAEVKDARKLIASLKGPSETEEMGLGRLTSELEEVGWVGQPPMKSTENLFSLLSSLNEAVVVVESAVAKIGWIRNPTLAAFEDENKKLITDSNILTALRGAFAAYGKMDQKQFRHIVDAFNSSVYNE